MRRAKPERRAINKVTVQVTEDGRDVLRRIALLHTAVMRVLAGANLIRVCKADYEIGCIEMIVESTGVTPDIAPGSVTVRVEPWPTGY